MSESPWWTFSATDSAAQLRSDPAAGLSEAEAAQRLATLGPNRLPEPPRTPEWLRLLRQFHNPLIYVLLAAGAVTAALGDWIDAGVIFGVVVINGIIGWIQEGKAEQALAAVRGLLAPQALVIRDGQRMTIPGADLVPGDLVVLSAGDRVPADLRLVAAKALRAVESALTGESVPVDKSLAPVAAAAPLGDRACMAFSGTLIAAGQGLGLVIATGAQSEIGRIGALVQAVDALTTPLVRRLDALARRIAAAILILGAAAFAWGVFVVDLPRLDAFLAVVGLTVGAIPEGLPAIITIVLTIGARAMAQNRAIIRRLPAVETLGGVSVICTDKTGTLTRNEMTAVRVLTPSRELRISGVGYGPEGGFHHHDQDVAPGEDPALIAIARCALLCNDASLRQDDSGAWVLNGDPTEGALAVFALKAGLDPAVLAQEQPRHDALPFDSAHRVMATLHPAPEGGWRIYLKGAPEEVLRLCVAAADGAPFDPAAWLARMEAAAQNGERVLALAEAACATPPEDFAAAPPPPIFTLLGLVGVMDPPREEAQAALRTCLAAGVRVKMITGDHAATATAIGRRLGLSGDRALTGAEIEGLDAAGLRAAALAADVIARAGPEHKLRVVQALQAEGHLVAMTGDGVNDAPALKAADIGVAMGGRGADAAREASDLVLTDDNFATIARAVRHGRVIYDNIAKSLLFVLPTNVAEGGVILVALLTGIAAPVTAGQILWINMVAAVTLALALAFEPAEDRVMAAPPRRPDAPLISRVALWRMGYVSLLLILATFALFDWSLARGASLEEARTVAVNLLAVGQIGYLFSTRYGAGSAFRRDLVTGNPAALGVSLLLILLQLGFTYAPPLQGLFQTAPISAGDWGAVAAVSVALFLIVEAEKAVMRRLGAAVL